MAKIRNRNGENNPSWKRGWAFSSDGAIFIHENGTQVLEHRKIAGDVFGKPLPPNTIVHHIDRNPANNEKSNLVICENDAYHKLLHYREAAYYSCGNANWLKCRFCKEYDDPDNLYVSPKQRKGNHRNCRNAYMREYNKKKKNGN